MFRGRRREYASIGTVALVAIVVGILTWPVFPSLERYRYGNPYNSQYRPGGKQCDPAVLATGESGRERTRDTDACKKEAEEYRQNTSDLIQQTRAADAAKAQADIASQGLWTSWLQTIGGLLTLAAAVGAAVFARDAARETRRGADAAENATKEMRRIGEAQVTSYLSIIKGYIDIVGSGAGVVFEVKNTGQSPAKAPRYYMHVHRKEDEIDPKKMIREINNVKHSLPDIGSTVVEEEYRDVELAWDIKQGSKQDLFVRIDLIWHDVFGIRYVDKLRARASVSIDTKGRGSAELKWQRLNEKQRKN
jgi:hypothetical protein